jgi:DNA-binding ferritin-like protein
MKTTIRYVESLENRYNAVDGEPLRRHQGYVHEKKKIMKLTKSGLKIRDVIEKAIKDHVITNSEYEEIMRVAQKDGMVDDHEQQLLGQFQGMLENGMVKRVKG